MCNDNQSTYLIEYISKRHTYILLSLNISLSLSLETLSQQHRGIC